MKKAWSALVFGVVCLSIGILVGSGLETQKPSRAIAESDTLIKPKPAVRATQFFDFSDLAETVQPAVVNIATTRIVTRQEMNPFFDLDQLPPQFRDLFRFFGPQAPNQNQLPQKRKLNNSLGSGVIISAEGFVVTNNHVIKNADEIQVVLNDGTSLAAEIVGTDDKTDVALLKIVEKGQYPYLKFGNSDDIRVGEWVLAVGNPFGLNHTFTAGIVSAKGRRIGSDITYQDFIQTDASINPGNSGGPLLNLQGELVGVNTAIFSRTGQSAGIGFAIPSNLVKFVVDQLKTKQRVDRGYLGVLIQPIDDQIAESLGLDEPVGALVTKVLDDGPAGKAGIEVGDLILAFNGEEIREMTELPLKVSLVPPGEKGIVTVLRDGKKFTIAIKLGELPTDKKNQSKSKPQHADESPTEELYLGISVRQPTAQEREALDLDVNYGLLVVHVDPDSASYTAGIRKGDVLMKADNIKLATSKDLSKAITDAEKRHKKAILLQVNRRGENRFVGVGIQG